MKKSKGIFDSHFFQAMDLKMNIFTTYFISCKNVIFKSGLNLINRLKKGKSNIPHDIISPKKQKTNLFNCLQKSKTSALLGIFTILSLCIIPTNVGAVSEEQEGVIEQNCSSIRQSLKQLQRADSKVRVYLGTSYETIITNFMTPLSVRLANNGIEAGDLDTLKSDFTTARKDFVTTYTDYQKSLEELVAYDCWNDASGFYEKLEATRVKRASLNQITVQMRSMIGKHSSLVTELEGTYEQE